ncbi:MAG TPA: RDD family protein [Pirellulaceae bacterium]|nr:RDD family protein [Pirellulaceae bacterium]
MSTVLVGKYEYRCTRCFHTLYANIDEAGAEKPCQYCGCSMVLPEATPERIARAESSLEAGPPSIPSVNLFADVSMSDEEMRREVKKQLQTSGGDGSGYASTAMASRTKRFLGAFVDGVLLVMACSVGVAILLGLVGAGIFPLESLKKEQVDWQTLNVLGVIYFPAAALALVQWNLIATRGQSIGKLLLGMRIVTSSGRHPGFWQGVVLRNWVRALLTMIPFFGLVDLLTIFGATHRCIHDFIADTYVVDVY